MDQPGPSTAIDQLQIDEEREKLLQTEDFKGELTNAVKYCNSLLEAEHLLTDTPPDKISSVSVVMGEVIFEEIVNILGDRKIIVEDDLILCNESDGEGTYEEVCKYISIIDEKISRFFCIIFMQLYLNL